MASLSQPPPKTQYPERPERLIRTSISLPLIILGYGTIHDLAEFNKFLDYFRRLANAYNTLAHLVDELQTLGDGNEN